MQSGLNALSSNATKAIKNYFDPVISNCRASFAGDQHRYFVARSTGESIFYLVKARAEEDQSSASIIQVPCAQAHYLKAFASVDIGDLKAAEIHFQEALRWSPANSVYLSELAHLRQIHRDWEAALELFEEAEKFAEAFSLEEVKVVELSRAKRGVGFVQIEMGNLDLAEEKFLEALELDSNDEKAKHELAYIEDLRKKASNK